MPDIEPDAAGTPARLITQFRRRLRDLRTEVGDPTGAEMIRAISNLSCPRLSASTLSEFASNKRPLSLPSQDFVHAYVTACLRYRGDSPDEIDRQVYGWLSSRTGIVVSLGTGITATDGASVTDANTADPITVPHAPDPNLVCDGEELGAALSWMIGSSADRISAVRPPPQSETELAEGLDITHGQLSRYVQGLDIPTASTWEHILQMLAIDDVEQARWTAAHVRVTHHATRCAELRTTGAGTSEPVALPSTPTTRAKAPSLRRAALISAAAIAGLIVLLTAGWTALSGPPALEPRADANTKPAEPSTPCGADGTALSVLNHHSGLFINNRDRPRMGLTQGATDIRVKYQPPSAENGVESCEVIFRQHLTEQRPSCLQSSDTGDIIWQPCDENQPRQRWQEERHWNDGTVVWIRFHSVADPALCLRQAYSGGIGTPLTATSCSSDWEQQWNLIATQPPPPSR